MYPIPTQMPATRSAKRTRPPPCNPVPASHHHATKVHAGVRSCTIPNLIPTTNPHEIRAWADRNHAVPTEILPHRVDGEPVQLRFLLGAPDETRIDVRFLSWEEFFLKFEALGLTFIYDNTDSGQNEILQAEDRSPYRATAYKVPKTSN